MASDKKEGLLPQDTTLSTSNGRLQVYRLVGSGATSEVYEGVLLDHHQQPRVAIKAMKPLEFAKAREFFFNEALTLAKLPEYEEETNSLFGLPRAFRIAPEFFGRGTHNGVEFLMMAWLDGRQLPDLLDESADGRLPEQQAVVAGFHLFRMLDLLHTKLKKSYIDLKLENLWWEGSVTGGQLRLTDFGTMESIEPGDDHGARRDLIVASAYLCKMLTGYMPEHVAGELRDQVVPIIQRSDFISWGARQLLSWLLHPNASERPKTASDVLNPPNLPGKQDMTGKVGLMALADYWDATRPPERLAAMKDTAWERALASEGNARLMLLSRSRALLDIWARRSPNVDRQGLLEDERQLDELLQQSGVLENGRALFSSGSYSQAEALFAQGRRQSYEPARIALFRRWAYLAQMGLDPKVTLAPRAKNDLELVVKYLGERNWAAAARQLDDLRPALGPAAAFARLEADLALYMALDEAGAARHDGDFAAARDAYDRALEALRRLPNESDDILSNETGQLLPERERLAGLATEKEGQTAGEALMRQAKTHLAQERKDEAWTAARRALVVETFNREDRLNELAGMTDSALQKGDYALAAALAGIALDVPATANPLLWRFRLANKLRDAEIALNTGDIAAFLAEANAAAAVTSDSRYLSPLLKKAQEWARKSYDAITLRTLADMESLDETSRATLRTQAKNLDDNWRRMAEDATEKQRERIYPIVNDLLGEIAHHLHAARPASSDRPHSPGWRLEKHLHYLINRGAALKKARELLPQVEARSREAGGYRLEEVQRVRARVDQLLEELKNETVATREAEARNKQQAAEQKATLAALYAPLTPPGTAGEPDLQLQTARHLLLGSRWYLTVVDPDDTDVSRWADQAAVRVDYLRPQEWSEMEQLAAGRLKAFQDTFAQADETFQSGELIRDGQHLNVWLAPYEGTDEYQAFAEKLGRAVEWQRADAYFANLPATPYRGRDLAGLRSWLPLSLPPAFWQRSAAAAWLERTRDAAADEAGRSMDEIRRPFRSPMAATGRYGAGSYTTSGGYGGVSGRDALGYGRDDPAGDHYSPTDSRAPADEPYSPPAGDAPGDAAHSWPQPAESSGRAQTYDPYATTARKASAASDRYRPAAAPGPEALLERLKWWLDAAATRRLTIAASDVATGVEEWNANTFLRDAARAAMNRDAAALEQAVEGGPLPTDVDRALEQLTAERWREAVRSVGVPRQLEETQPEPTWRSWLPWPRWAIVGGGIVALLFLLAIPAVIFRDDLAALIRGPLDATPTDTANGTPVVTVPVSPTMTLAAVSTPATATLEPTLTITPTLLPTLSPTPQPTPTVPAAQPEDSIYHVGDPAQLLPPPPVAGAILWQMTPAEFQPALDSGVWQTESDETLGDFNFIEDFTNPVSLVWTHDQPLAEGLYQLYALDTTTRSLGSQTFEVFLDGQSAEPVRGVRVARFDYRDGGSQTEPSWLPIGAYEVTNGQRLSVRATADAARGVSFAIPAMLVARLADRERDLLLGLPEPSLGRPLLAVLDDDRIELSSSNADGTQYFSPTQQWPTEPQEMTPLAEGEPPPPVWSGRYHATTLESGNDYALRAEWQPLGRLPAGEYQIFVYVPAGSNAVVNYELLADGQPVDETILTNTQQREFAGEWVDMGIWTLPQEAAVGVRATALGNENRTFYPTETQWTIGIDAVALLRADG